MKYRVYGVASAFWKMGEYEATSKEEAKDMANEDLNANYQPMICHACSHKVEIGEKYDMEVERNDLLQMEAQQFQMQEQQNQQLNYYQND